MSAQQTPLAIESFEKARGRDRAPRSPTISSSASLYLAARRLPEARDSLDRVPASDPEYPMALFKRAQVSVLLNEPIARRGLPKPDNADATTRPLIEAEKLFRSQ